METTLGVGKKREKPAIEQGIIQSKRELSVSGHFH
jgi:hypothetical protein